MGGYLHGRWLYHFSHKVTLNIQIIIEWDGERAFVKKKKKRNGPINHELPKKITYLHTLCRGYYYDPLTLVVVCFKLGHQKAMWIMNWQRITMCTLETKQPHELWLAPKLPFAHLKSNSPKNYKLLKNLLAHFISWDRKSFRFNTEIPLRLIDIQAQVVLIKWSFWWEVGSTVRLDGDSILEVTGTQVCFNSNLI